MEHDTKGTSSAHTSDRAVHSEPAPCSCGANEIHLTDEEKRLFERDGFVLLNPPRSGLVVSTEYLIRSAKRAGDLPAREAGWPDRLLALWSEKYDSLTAARQA